MSLFFLSGCVKPSIVDAQLLEEMDWEQVCETLYEYDALIIPGGFGKRGIEGKIRAIRFAREYKKPILGICLGMQLMVIEFARNVLGYKDANSTEFDPNTPYPVITLMEEQKRILQLGGTMRLGSQPMKILKDTRLWHIYGEIEQVFERHRHRYEVNYDAYPEMFKLPNQDGNRLVISAQSNFIEAIELENHPYFIGIQYHPELKTKVGNPHPLFRALIDSIKGN